MVPFTGRLTSTTPDGAEVFDFWHGGGGRWRIEQGGEVLYVDDGETAYNRGRDGQMVRIVQGRRIAMSWVGKGLGPRDIAGPDGVLHKMSRGAAALTEPSSTRFAGREAWTVELGAPGTGSDQRMTVTIDSSSGVIVGVVSTQGLAVDVEGLSTDPIDDDVFRWRSAEGPVPQPDPRQSHAVASERLAILTAIDEALGRRADVLATVEREESVDDARRAVADLLGITRGQADSVLALQIRRLVAEDRRKIAAEAAEVRTVVDDLAQQISSMQRERPQ